MNLHREDWNRIKLKDVCSKVKSINFREQKGVFNYIDIGSIDSDSKRVKEVQEVDWVNASSRARQIIMKGDTLFSTVRVNLERIAFLDSEVNNGIASTGFTVLRSNGKVLPEFLFYSTITPKFVEGLVKLQKGTAYPAVSDKIIFNEEILLPSLEEQKLIATLFQSIETAIEQFENQEKNIDYLQKTLINGLLERKPNFGNLLKENNLINTKFGELADCIEKHDKERKNSTRFVGLENINSGSFKIESWGNVSDGTTFTKRFNSGDVLFGKRRSYLKKVAVADFDGICSGDILVFRAKVSTILPGLLPYYVASEEFIQNAVTTSAGSLSPRTKWKDLREFKVSIPDLQTQSKVLEVFDQIQLLLNHLKVQKNSINALKQNLLNEILG